MKMEYIKPTSSVMELDYTGMLCMSAKFHQTFEFDTDDTQELGVRKDQSSVWNGRTINLSENEE